MHTPRSEVECVHVVESWCVAVKQRTLSTCKYSEVLTSTDDWCNVSLGVGCSGCSCKRAHLPWFTAGRPRYCTCHNSSTT